MKSFILITTLFFGAQAFTAQIQQPSTPRGQNQAQAELFQQIEADRLAKYNAEKNPTNRTRLTEPAPMLPQFPEPYVRDGKEN